MERARETFYSPELARLTSQRWPLSPRIEAELEVTVLQRTDGRGKVFHYGWVVSKPDVRQRPVSEDNDGRRRLKQAAVEKMNRRGFTQLSRETYSSRMLEFLKLTLL
jgi:hypothetical protein